MKYRDEIFGKLLKLDGELVIDEKVKPENRERFVTAVKEIIDMEIDKANGVLVQFSAGLKKVRKITPKPQTD